MECPIALAKDLVAAFPALVSHHQDLVFGLARRSSRGVPDAEDLTQDTFLRAYRALTGYPPDRIAALHLRGWLASITLNLARNRARRQGPPTAALEAAIERPDGRARGPESQVEQRESTRSWAARLRALPEAQQAAVGLRHVDGLSYPELAIALGKPIGTIKSDVHRGVRALRKAYVADSVRLGVRSDGNDGTSVRARLTPPVRLSTEVVR